MTRRFIVFALLAIALAGASLDGQIRYRFRLPQTLSPPGPPDIQPPEPPPFTDRGGYRPQMYPSHGGNATGGCRVGPNGVPRIVKVNSLADTNTLSAPGGAGTSTNPFVHTGTLRGALTTGTWPRCIVFEVGGYITIGGNITMVGNPYITIAGQTAPEPGIWIRASATALPNTVTERAFYVATHNVVIQHLRIRMGNTSCNSAIQFYNFDNAANIVNNNIIDHVSIAWNQDEGVFYSYDAGTSLIWRSIVAETLVGLTQANGGITYNCPGGGRSDGHGIAIGWGDGFSILQNVIANNVERNPQADGGFSGALQNNVWYGPSLATWLMSFRNDSFAVRWDGNYIKRDTNTGTRTGVRVTDARAGSQLYLNDNVFDDGGFSPAYTQYTQDGTGSDPRVGTPPATTTVSGYVPMTATVAFNYVLTRAGARPSARDSVDTRIIGNVTNRTGGFVNENSSIVSFPTLTSTTRTYTIPANPFSTAAGQAFRSNMEMDLESCATGTTCGGNTITPLEPSE